MMNIEVEATISYKVKTIVQLEEYDEDVALALGKTFVCMERKIPPHLVSNVRVVNAPK